MGSNQSWDEALAGSLVGLAILLTIVALVIGIWLTVKAVNLLVRVMARYPHNKPMWVAIGFFCLAFLAVVATNGRVEILDGLAVLSLAALLMTAKAVELYYDELFQSEVSRESVTHAIIHEPWWNAA